MPRTLELHADRLLPFEPAVRALARELYASVANLPIISPHGHTDPRWFAGNETFGNATDLLLVPDHYVFRMLYSQGIALEDLGVRNPQVDPRTAWRLLAQNCGLAAGHTFVHEAVADLDLRQLAQALMSAEAAPTIAPAPGQDLAAYADALIGRFANPALNHRLIQIAMDGSQKIPQRWLETLAANATLGRKCPAILAAIAAWIGHLTGANGPVDDPRSAELADIASGPDPAEALFGASGLLAGPWSSSVASHTVEE